MCDGSRRYTRGVSGPLDTCNSQGEGYENIFISKLCFYLKKKPLDFVSNFS